MAKKNDKDRGEDLAFAHQNSLRPWTEVAREWERRSGQRLTHQRCWQICMAAQGKIRRALERIAGGEDGPRQGGRPVGFSRQP